MVNAYEIAVALAGSGKKPEKAGEWWSTLCPVHNDHKNSLSIKNDPNDSSGIKVECHAGCDFKIVKDKLRDLNLLPEWQPTGGAGNETDKNKPENKPDTGKTAGRAKADVAKWIWSQAKETTTEGNLQHLDQYFKNRRIIWDQNIDFQRPPCFRWGEYWDKKSGQTVRQIVAAATKPGDERPNAVQRLYIDTENYKKTGAKMYGDMKGRAVHLYRKEPQDILFVGEGIETTLSAIQALRIQGKQKINGAAALSSSGMENIVLPEETGAVLILVDSDLPPKKENTAGYAGQKAAIKLAERAEEEGRAAYLVTPDDTCFTDDPKKLDFNDLLNDPNGLSIYERIQKAVRVNDLNWNPEQAVERFTKKQATESPGTDTGTSTGTGDATNTGDVDTELRKMNKKFAAVLVNGEFRIIRECYDKEKKQYTTTFIKQGAFHNYYQNQLVTITDENNKKKEVPISKIWTSWAGRRSYEDVVFDPEGKYQGNFYNFWQGFSLTPEQGSWKKIKWHIAYVLCSGNKEYYDYLLAWMARILQDPGGKRPGVAIVFRGPKGTGKGLFANAFGKIFGNAFVAIGNQKQFTGNFNYHLSKCILTLLDEAVWGGDRKGESQLKHLITEPTVLFEPKGVDSMNLDNNLNIIISSNSDWVVPASVDERRFFVLDVSDIKIQDHDYFADLEDEFENGGVEAMMYDLMYNLDISGVNLRKAPKTQGLTDQVEEGLDKVMQFWQDVLDRGYLISKEDMSPGYAMRGNEITEWPEQATKGEIMDEFFNRYARNIRSFEKPTETKFWKRTWKWWPGGKPDTSRPYINDKREFVIDIPSLQEAKKAFSDYTGGIDFSYNNLDNDEPWNDQF